MKTVHMKPDCEERELKGIYCLLGEEAVGKSPILKDLCHSLQRQAIYYYEQKGQNDSHDFRVSLKIDGFVVGICTAGESPEIIEDDLEFFREQQCEIAIMAIRIGKEGGMPLLECAKTLLDKVFVKAPAPALTSIQVKPENGEKKQTLVNRYAHALGGALSAGSLAKAVQKVDELAS